MFIEPLAKYLKSSNIVNIPQIFFNWINSMKGFPATTRHGINPITTAILISLGWRGFPIRGTWHGKLLRAK